MTILEQIVLQKCMQSLFEQIAKHLNAHLSVSILRVMTHCIHGSRTMCDAWNLHLPMWEDGARLGLHQVFEQMARGKGGKTARTIQKPAIPRRFFCSFQPILMTSRCALLFSKRRHFGLTFFDRMRGSLISSSSVHECVVVKSSVFNISVCCDHFQSLELTSQAMVNGN